MKKSSLRLVFDTNVIVSASLSESSVSAAAFYSATDHGTVLLSEATLREMHAVLEREKFDRYVGRGVRRRFLRALVRDAELVTPRTSINECRDPDDDKYLELAVDGRADCIVSGDKDLLVPRSVSRHPDHAAGWLRGVGGSDQKLIQQAAASKARA